MITKLLRKKARVKDEEKTLVLVDVKELAAKEEELDGVISTLFNLAGYYYSQGHPDLSDHLLDQALIVNRAKNHG